LYFTLEVNGAQFHQPLADNVAVPVAEYVVEPEEAPPAPRGQTLPPAPLPMQAAPAPTAPAGTQPSQPAPPSPAPQPKQPAPAPPAPEKTGWDDEPKELELDLSEMIDLEFEKPQGGEDLDMEKNKD
jgi:hypothetical protein